MISAVVPARDCAPWIAEALSSLAGQSLPPDEILLLDDGSRDGTAEKALACGIPSLRVIRSDEPRGISAGLTRLVSEARGRYIVRMDADDVALPDRLATQMAAIERDDLAVVGSWARRFGRADTLHRFAPGDGELKAGLVFASPFCHPSVVVDRERLSDPGELRYDSAFDGAEDHDLWIRLRRHGRYGNVPRVLLRWRLHGNNAGSHPEKLARQVALGSSLRTRLLDEMGVSLAAPQRAALDRRCAAQVLRDREHRDFLDALVAMSRGSCEALGAPRTEFVHLLGTHWDLSCHFAVLAQAGIPSLWRRGRRELGLDAPTATYARIALKSALRRVRRAPIRPSAPGSA